ncbi:extracellular solute-binding protein, partial [Streptomyces sp. NPDC048665]|uniref:ABC transporter substrate-binding protein n=1 Tax=Streptomyces sp. NPDC048665 TaxID=3155490 RepID=UPI00343E9536
MTSRNGATRNRFAAVAATTALVLGLTAACGSSGGPNSGTIHVLVYGDAANKVEKQIVDTFNKTSKVKAVLDTIPGADYQSKLNTIINTPQAPDVFFNWGGGSIAPFVKKNLLLPLDDMIAKDPGLKSNFLPSVFNTAVIDGKSYGVPMRGTQPVLLFNNKKVLASAGLSVPKTWDDLINDVKVLKAKGITPIALGGGDQWPTLMWFEYVFDRLAGPDLFRKALAGDKTAWASPDSQRALGMLKQLTDAGAFGSNFDSVKFTDGGSPALLAKGKAAFELMGSWEYSTQQSGNPDFA